MQIGLERLQFTIIVCFFAFLLKVGEIWEAYEEKYILYTVIKKAEWKIPFRLQSIPGVVISCSYDLDDKLTGMLFGKVFDGANEAYTSSHLIIKQPYITLRLLINGRRRIRKDPQLMIILGNGNHIAF